MMADVLVVAHLRPGAFGFISVGVLPFVANGLNAIHIIKNQYFSKT